MSWDAIGAVAELLGAIGVIASLVYLAGQIRDSREQMSRNTQAVRCNTGLQLTACGRDGRRGGSLFAASS